MTQTSPAISLASILPPQVARMGEALLDQQMWCWGCDVRRSAGNLLLQYGFEQRPSPVPRFRSAYTCTLHPACVLTLWGWGVWLAQVEQGSLFISRTRFQMHALNEVIFRPCAWQACDLPLPACSGKQKPIRIANTNVVNLCNVCLLLAQTLTWVANYEDWLNSHVEPYYRETTIRTWPSSGEYKTREVPAQRAEAWREIAEQVQAKAKIHQVNA